MPPPRPVETTLHIDARLDPAPLLATIAAHAVPGVEHVERAPDDDAHGSVRRLVRGPAGPVEVRADLAPGAVTLTTPTDSRTAPDLVRLAARWFSLDDDLDDVHARLAPDERLAPLLRTRPDLRLLGHVDGFEVAAQTVLGQQVTLAAARVFTGRLAAAFGTPGSSDPGPSDPRRPDLTRFPSPATIAALDPATVQEAVRVPATRARTLVVLAQACADGLDLSPSADPAGTRAQLLALPGIGPWTVEYLALRVLHDRDALPAGDLVLRRALGVADARAVTARAARWSPWRAYAAQHLWTSVAYAARDAVSRSAAPSAAARVST